MKTGLFKGLALAFAAATIMLASGQLLAEGYGKQKVAYHINTDDVNLHNAALTNIQNHIDAVGAENMEIKVVLHGNGLALVLEPDALPRLPAFKHASADMNMAARLDGLRNQGVRFQVCNVTVVGRNVNVTQDLYNVDEVDIVPSGVAELAHLQTQGYTYIKP